MLESAKLLIQDRRLFDYPSMEYGMVDFDAAFFHHFFELLLADRIRHISTDALQDHVMFKRLPLNSIILLYRWNRLPR